MNFNIVIIKNSLYQKGLTDQFYRGALFMGVMTAIRYDQKFKTFYERLKTNGKQTTQAQIAVMRKMILVAHSLYKNETQYIKKVEIQKENR
ncbi:transposase, IS116/IS110/IS902 family [sediment metagenome]|uniref:Transposase, IS116/IS110/IS902 family n=1 Tax=sediment metagenome TaxID=749907 RepID=D9PHH5_9ZZZZ